MIDRKWVLAAALAGAVVLAGCEGNLSVVASFRADGSGELRVEVLWSLSDEEAAILGDRGSLGEMISTMDDNTTRADFELFITEMFALKSFTFDPDAAFSTLSRGDYVGFSLTWTVSSYEEWNSLLSDGSELGPQLDGSVLVDGTTATLTAAVPPLEPSEWSALALVALSEDEPSLTATFAVGSPFGFEQNNADSSDGDVAVWDLVTGEKVEIEATWNTEPPDSRSGPPIAALVVGVGLAIGLAAAAVHVIRKRGRI